MLGYVRVSGREQATDGTSLDAQRERIERWCSERGYPAPEIRLEVESAGEEKIERRLELHRLTGEARPGDVVIVALLDRWSRDIVFGVSSIRALTRSGVRWVSIHEQIDASTPHGDEQLGLRMWIAESERKRIRDRTVGRREELRAKGLWAVGSVPFGYRRGPRERRMHLLLEVDPERAPVIVEMYTRAATGEGVRAIAAWLDRVPGAPRHAAQVHRAIRGRIYLGEMRDGDGETWTRGAHPALIDHALWERAQCGLQARKVQGRLPRGDRTAGCILRGIVRCGVCGRGTSIAIGRFDHTYYVCAKRRRQATEGPCAGPYLRVSAVDPIATDAVLARIGELHNELDSADGIPPVETDFAAARLRLQGRVARAVQLAVDGAITSAELAGQRARVEAELSTLARREADAALAQRATEPGTRASISAALTHLGQTWAHLTADERRDAVRLLAAKVEIDEAGALRWTWRTVAELAGRG